MPGIFPQEDWLKGLVDFLNMNEDYARIAKNWEGDLIFSIKAEDALTRDVNIYMDLWHGKCRGGRIMNGDDPIEAKFVLIAPFSNYVRILKGDLDPMQALMTRKLIFKGNMGYLLRNVPTVLEFVRSAQLSTEKVLGE